MPCRFRESNTGFGLLPPRCWCTALLADFPVAGSSTTSPIVDNQDDATRPSWRCGDSGRRTVISCQRHRSTLASLSFVANYYRQHGPDWLETDQPLHPLAQWLAELFPAFARALLSATRRRNA